MPIEIPEERRKTLARLLQLGTDEKAAFKKALEEASPHVLVDDLAKDVAKATDWSYAEASDAIEVLAGLYVAMDRRESTPTDVAQDVIDAAKREDLPGLDAEAVDWDAGQEFLKSVLDLHQTLGVTAKVLDLLTSYEHAYCSAKILTDFRPVFGPDTTEEPEGYVISHNLRLLYHEGNELRPIYIAMDSSQLDDLYHVLERARQKEQSLRSVAKRRDMTLIRE